jgi:hypothetical protein
MLGLTIPTRTLRQPLCPLWVKSWHQVAYSIIWSAWTSNAGDTAKPNAFAVRIIPGRSSQYRDPEVKQLRE